MKKLILLFSLALMLSCTENQRVKSFGGTGKLNVPCGQKVVNITFKGEDLWYSTLPMEPDYVPKVHNFREESSFGIMEGNYLIIESKCN